MKQHRVNLTAVCNGKVEIYNRTDTKRAVWHARMNNPDGKGYLVKPLGTLVKHEAVELAYDWHRDINNKLKNNLALNNRRVSQMCKIYLHQLENSVKRGPFQSGS
ncbi:MAG: hypothetical protein COB93_09755 [Sneathiella sp.]|nr:MAG: hypothetical protein COB93_09755 [Sneathiella sp.]